MLVVALLAFARCTLPTVVHGMGVPYSLVVLGHDDLFTDKTVRIWDSDDSTCFSMPAELNETMASVRLFLDPPVDLGLVRVVSEPQPNVVYYLLEDNSNGFPTAEKDDLEGNVWIYGGELSAKVRGVDIHSVTELCEVTIFNISDNIDKIDSTLPVMAIAAILATVLFWKRRKVPCLHASYVSELRPAKRQGRRPLPLTPDEEEDDMLAFDTSDTAALFHSRISGQPEWTQSQRNGQDAGRHRGSNPDIISDLAFVNHLLEASHEYATLEPPAGRESDIKHQDV
ncbi:uncharacterized protein [Dermacentor andersoni]|uniref:uncharacterized protein isoform X2 n=1 Tax=Dermacentor andersoni TaxID=34620 RepID=UPI002417229D|nr:uncharacterized protein LOC126528082 isoform X2 [Dermacentor andersoni]